MRSTPLQVARRHLAEAAESLESFRRGGQTPPAGPDDAAPAPAPAPSKATGLRAVLRATLERLREVTAELDEACARSQVLEDENSALRAEIERLQSRSEELSSAIGYLRTPEYKERQARSILNLQRPGEFVVALPEEKDSGSAEGEAESGSGPRTRKWWLYFFGTL